MKRMREELRFFYSDGQQERFKIYAKWVPSPRCKTGPQVSMSARVNTWSQRAAAAWPEVVLSPRLWDEHLATLGLSARGQAPTHADELYLACAALHSDSQACDLIERLYMTKVAASLARRVADPPTQQALLQKIREKILVGPPPAIAKYKGNTRLEHWIRLTARRCVVDHYRSLQRQARQLLQIEKEPRSSPRGIESQLDHARGRVAFERAVTAALGGLSARDRNLLRLYYGAGITVDGLGRAYGVHRSTAARWVARLREELFAAVRTHMQQECGIGDSEFERLANDLHGQVDLILSSWHAEPTT